MELFSNLPQMLKTVVDIEIEERSLQDENLEAAERTRAESQLRILNQTYTEQKNNFIQDLEELRRKERRKVSNSVVIGGILSGLKDSIPNEMRHRPVFEAIDRITSDLELMADTEAAIHGATRHIKKFGGLYVLLAATAIVLGWREHNKVPTFEKIETVAHYLAADTAVKKVEPWLEQSFSAATFRHELRKGGWMVDVIRWPWKPTDREVEFSANGMVLTILYHNAIANEFPTCATPMETELLEESLADVVSLTHRMASRMRNIPVADQDQDFGMVLFGEMLSELGCLG